MEPERKIEKWLRAFARKRREQSGAPLELHSATRRILQSEVERRAPKRREGNVWLNLLAVLRPRPALAFSVVAVCIIGAWLLLPALTGTGSKSRQRAKMSESGRVSDKDTAPASVPPSTPVTPPPANATAPSVSTIQPASPEKRAAIAGVDQRDEMKLQFDAGAKDMKSTTTQPTREVASATMPATAVEAGTATATRSDLARRVEANRSLTGGTGGIPVRQPAAETALKTESGVGTFSMAVAPTAQESQLFVNAPATGSTQAFGGGGAFGAGWAAGAPPNQGRYYRIIEEPSASANAVAAQRTPAATPGAALADAPATNALPVLDSFAVEQSGREMRVVDSDGSVYSGYVQADNAPPGEPLTAAAAASVRGSLDRAKQDGVAGNFEAAQNYTFRVSGTNRSLRQSVEFSGNLFAITNSVRFGYDDQLNRGAATGAVGFNQSQVVPAGIPRLQLMNSRIKGTVLIDNSRRLEINAAPAQPQR